MRFFIAFLILFLNLQISNIVFAKPINWNEIEPDLKNSVIEKFPTLSTNSPSLEDIDKLIRFLMSKGSYEDVQINEDETTLKLDFKILKSINRLIFNGMTSFDANDVTQLIQLEQGQKFDSRIINDLREKIKSYYFEQGFLAANVDISIIELPGNLVDIIVKIQEGKPLRVNSIFFSCPNKELLPRLNRLIKRSIGKIYNPQLSVTINKQMQEYFREHGYIRATASAPEIRMDTTRSEVDLTYQIERTEQYNVIFDGNFMVPSPRLVSATDLNTLSSANPNILPELIAKLKEFYWKKGYAKVEIKGEEKLLLPNIRSSLYFHINEGSTIKIENIEIQGVISQPEKYYNDFLKEHSGETISKGFFHRNDFEQGLKNLIIELQNSGYLKAKLISSRYLYNKTKTRMTVSVNIDEGPLTRINKIGFYGLKQLKDDELLKVLKLTPNESLKLSQLELDIQQLKFYCQEKGFLEFRILNEKENLVKYNDDNTLAELEFKIEEGPQVKVGSILIDGNNLTKDYVLRKEVDFKEGDILTPSKIEESTKRLQKLSLFNSVEIKTLEQRTQIADRTVIIKVSERAPGLFNVGAGVTNERGFTLRGFTGVAYRNIQGSARAFSSRAEINYNVVNIKFPEMKLTLGYLEPYLFDTRTKGRINFTRDISVPNYVANNDYQTGTDRYQFDFLLEQNLTSHILFTYDLWSISHLRDFYLKKNIEPPNYITPPGLLNLAWTGPSLEIDYRDHPFNPTHGTLTRFQLEYSNPFLGNTRSIEYMKTTGSFTHYFPILSPTPLVFANSFKIGEIDNLSGKDGVPYDKKGFILGGISTIRGFEPANNEGFPNNQDLKIANGASYLLKERSQFFLIKSEIRFPLYGSMGGAIFYDGGMIKVDQIKFKDPYRDAAGFGLRYATPVGPANIEFAWKLDTDKSRNESPFRFHISIGTF